MLPWATGQFKASNRARLGSSDLNMDQKPSKSQAVGTTVPTEWPKTAPRAANKNIDLQRAPKGPGQKRPVSKEEKDTLRKDIWVKSIREKADVSDHNEI